jgi:hypothetical protein
MTRALIIVAVLAVLGIAAAIGLANHATAKSTGHNTYWNQGYQYGKNHITLASSSPQPTSQWCGIAAYQDSGYTHLKQEGDWAHGCEAALNGH